MIETGTLLQNRYRVEKKIGQGGMGTVFIGKDERFGSVVAIKETLFLDEKYRKAFEREARLLNSLKHPALPRVSDHFEDSNGQFLVMEYIEGDDLSEIMDRDQKAFSLKDVLDWTLQLLDALKYLHTQATPVIHRDIKPQNLKLTPRGQIILLDFGLAKGNPTDFESSTAAKSMFGYSRNYASIEQIQGSGTDERSDLYALAATAYHLLTGVPPADALTRAMNVLSGKPDPLIPVHEINSDIPVNISGILYNAMALDANQRPESAEKMRKMLSENKNIANEDFKTRAETPIAQDIFTQETKIKEQPQTAKQSEIKTELFKVNPSQATVLKPLIPQTTAIETETKSSRRGLAIGATALGALVVSASAFSAFYIFNSEAESSNSNISNTAIERTTTIINASPEAENTTSNEILTNTNVSNNTPQKRETVKAEVKDSATPKIEPKPTKTQTTEKTEVEGNTVEETEPTPKPIKTPIFGKRFPRFPGNIDQPQPNPKDERRRRRQQRQQPLPE